MNYSQESYLDLVNEAYTGKLRLPAFQRDWKWESSKVISLYDSLRKKFPIGNFLFLKISDAVNLAPRPFAAQVSTDKQKTPERLALDGQQRITAGIALIHGLNNKQRYFLNLDAIKKLADEDEQFDLDNEESIRRFAQDMDDGDDYIISSAKQTEENTLLLEKHLLSTRHLVSESTLRRSLELYSEKYPEMKRFCDYVITPHFSLTNNYQCPVITLTEKESISAITRIFATVNTTGKRLTPIEIVTATLFAGDINLRKQVDEFQEASDYLRNMDPSGEVLLQTIALLSDQTPKKSLLPKTITKDRFNKHFQDALDLLDGVGELLTLRLGVGLKDTTKLLPYDSLLAPMAAVFKKVRKLKGVPEEKAKKKLERWFIGSALIQRYQEGVHNKQEKDARDFAAYIDDDNAIPAWLTNVYIPPEIKLSAPEGAHGRLLQCLINRERPTDPLNDIPIGFYDGASTSPEFHHLWPRKYCVEHLDGWSQQDSSELALNIAPVTSATNNKWHKMNPADQIADIEQACSSKQKRDEIYRKLFLSEECVAIMKKQKKSKKDYQDFIEARHRELAKRLKDWNIPLAESNQET